MFKALRGMFGAMAPQGGGAPGAGGNWADKLMMIGTGLSDIADGEGPVRTMALMDMRRKAAQDQQLAAMRQQAAGLFGGRASPSGASVQDMVSATMAGDQNGPTVRDVVGTPTSMMSIRDMAPVLANMQAAGLDIKPYLDIAQASAPSLKIGPDGTTYDERDPSNLNRRFRNPQAVNNTIVDMNNPDNEGYVVPSAPVAGSMPIYDNRGRVVDYYMPSGALGVIGAVEGAKAAGQAPFEFINVPTRSGAPRTVSKARAAGGDFVGQSPTDKIYSEGVAAERLAQDVERQRKAITAQAQLPTLDNMERLLPKVISGFGADERLKVARFLAATGNKGAEEEVKATETFILQGRELVRDIIKSFGANPTEGERKYAEAMAGADAQLSPQTLAEGIRLRRERLQRDLEAAGQQSSVSQRRAPPAAGTIVNGYQYKGGNPNSPSSWVKVN